MNEFRNAGDKVELHVRKAGHAERFIGTFDSFADAKGYFLAVKHHYPEAAGYMARIARVGAQTRTAQFAKTYPVL